MAHRTGLVMTIDVGLPSRAGSLEPRRGFVDERDPFQGRAFSSLGTREDRFTTQRQSFVCRYSVYSLESSVTEPLGLALAPSRSRTKSYEHE